MRKSSQFMPSYSSFSLSATSSAASMSSLLLADAQHSIEKIVGLIGFLDYCLEHFSNKAELAQQWEGLFRISPNESDFQSWVEATDKITTHMEMKQFLESQQEHNVIQLAARLLKHLLSKLDFPLFPMEFAVETVEEDDLASGADRALLGSLFADMFLHSIASTIPEKLAASYSVMGAQLFALLRHVSLESAKTKMDEYNLCVVLLPSVAGTRMDDTTTMEVMMNEAQLLKQFQAHHRDSQHCKFEMMVKYGRRIWGVVHAMSIDANSLESDLKDMRNRIKAPQQHRKSQVAAIFNNARAGLARKNGSMTLLHRPSLSAASMMFAQQQQAKTSVPTPPLKGNLQRSESKQLTASQVVGAAAVPPLFPTLQTSNLAPPTQSGPHSPAITKALNNSSRRRLSKGDSELASSPLPPRAPVLTRQGSSPLSLSPPSATSSADSKAKPRTLIKPEVLYQ